MPSTSCCSRPGQGSDVVGDPLDLNHAWVRGAAFRKDPRFGEMARRIGSSSTGNSMASGRLQRRPGHADRVLLSSTCGVTRSLCWPACHSSGPRARAEPVTLDVSVAAASTASGSTRCSTRRSRCGARAHGLRRLRLARSADPLQQGDWYRADGAPLVKTGSAPARDSSAATCGASST